MSKSNYEIILDFLIKMLDEKGVDYMNDENCLGLIFYGSRRGKFATSTSDLDLCFIYDDRNILVKGLEVVDGIEVEYFEKDKTYIFESAKKDYNSQNDAPFHIYGEGEIIFEREGTKEVCKLQQEIRTLFEKPFDPCTNDETLNSLMQINSRIEMLEEYSKTQNEYFDIIYYNTLDRIKTTYHRTKGITKLEISKAIRAYTEPEYAQAMGINIDEKYVELFIKALDSNNLSYEERYELIKQLFEYIQAEYKIEDGIRFEELDKTVYSGFLPFIDTSKESKEIVLSEKLKNVLANFQEKMKYEEDKDYIGMFVYGNNLLDESLTDLEVIAVFNKTRNVKIKGMVSIDGINIRYVESPKNKQKMDETVPLVHKTNKYGYLIPSNTMYACFAKKEKIPELEEYINELFKLNSKGITEEKYDENLSVIRNRIKRLKKYSDDEQHNYFDMYYNIILDKIINLYRRGKAYIDPEIEGNGKFITLFESAIRKKNGKKEKLSKMLDLYGYIQGDATFQDTYRIIAPMTESKPRENSMNYTLTRKPSLTSNKKAQNT